jgi:hypothetical protein
MKAPYEIYKKYRKAQKKYLKQETEAATKVCPANCSYNCKVDFPDRNMSIRMCTLGQNHDTLDPTKLLICNKDKQAEECNAYIPIYKEEEDIFKIIRDKSSNPVEKMKNYPDLVMLEWVMGNDLHNISEYDKAGALTRFLFWLKEKIENLILKRNSSLLVSRKNDNTNNKSVD